MLMVRKMLLWFVTKRIDKVVFTSTVAVYGFAEPGTDENEP